MTRREKINFWGRLFGSAILVCLCPMVFAWTILRFAGWYVKNIPSRKFPLAGYFQGWPTRFYEWLSGYLNGWAALPRFFSIIVATAGVLLTIAFFSGWFTLPIPAFVLWLALNFLFLPVYWISFGFTKSSHWDNYVEQAEPTAQILVGSINEYNKLSEEEKNKLKRHIADVQVGINKGSWVVSGGKAKCINPAAGILARFGGQGVLVVQEGHAVVLERSGRISRTVGYGTTYLEAFEAISQVVYLGTQRGVFEFEQLVTKDRVVIDTMQVSVFFKVDPGRKTDASGINAFDQKVIIGKIWSPKSAEREDKGVDLEGGVRSVTNTVLRDTVAQYNLGDLITATGTVRVELRTKLRDAIYSVTKDVMGILVSIVDIGKIAFPESAREKLLERWQVDWQAEIDKIRAESLKVTTLIDAQARQEAEVSEAAIAKMKADTKNYETVADIQTQQETLEAVAAIAHSRADTKKYELLKDAEARREAEESEAAIARARAEIKKHEMLSEAQGRRDAAIANADAAYHAIIAEAEAKRQARLKAAEAEQEYQSLVGKGKAAARRAEGTADAEVEAEKMRQAVSAVSHLDPETARVVMMVYGNTQTRRIMARLARQLENIGAVDSELEKGPGTLDTEGTP